MWSVFLLFLSYLDRNLVRGGEPLGPHPPFDAAERESKEMFYTGNGTLCAKVSVVEENYFYQLSDGIEEVRALVKPAAAAAAGGELLECSVIVDQTQVKSFVHACRLGLKRQKVNLDLETPFTHVEDAKMRCLEFHKRRSSERTGRTDSSVSVDKTLQRSKRGFTYPGTLWCGAGNTADHYGHLGKFAAVDSCCRDHDQCPHVIHAFSSNYGYTNFKLHSISHCDCDNTLQACLRKVNDTASRVVGQAFFNVLEAPCFEFSYQDQCVERHWYGVCKKYEKLPVAVLKESVPYDFGGIAVIDVFTAAPSKLKDSKEEDKNTEEREEKKPEGAAWSTGSPEEPSLTNVVTAAEDFIKVLATVSTSQSSGTAGDGAKGEAQTSEEKKKRKNEGKRKKKSRGRKGRGKWRKRKQKVEDVAGAKVEEGGATSAGPAGGSYRAEDVIGEKSNFIHDDTKNDPVHRKTDGFADGFDRGGKHEPSNDVMKDEPIKETTATSSATSPVAVLKVFQRNRVVTESKELVPTATSRVATLLTMPKTKPLRSKKGEGTRRKKYTPKEQSSSHSDTTGDLSHASVPTSNIITPTVRHKEEELKSHIDEEGPVVAAAAVAGAPIVNLKTQRSGSKERAEAEGGKVGSKISNSGPIVELVLRHSISVEDQKALTATGAPTPTLTRQVSQGPNETADMSPTFSVFKTKRSKDNRQRKRRPGKNTHNTSQDLESVLSTPAANANSLSRATTATTVINSKPTGLPVLEALPRHYTDKSLVTSAVTDSPVVTHTRQRTKGRTNAMPSAHRDYIGIHNNETSHETMTLAVPQSAAVLSKVDEMGKPTAYSHNSEDAKQELYVPTPITAFMTRMQLSIQKAREQFTRKRRRKTSFSLRQQ